MEETEGAAALRPLKRSRKLSATESFGSEKSRAVLRTYSAGHLDTNVGTDTDRFKVNSSFEKGTVVSDLVEPREIKELSQLVAVLRWKRASVRSFARRKCGRAGAPDGLGVEKHIES